MLNKVMLQGRIGTDIELKRTGNGVSVCSFKLAVGRDYKSGNIDTDWVAIVSWRNTAEFISRYFHKGDMILIVGSIQSREYTDRDDKKRTAIEVIADSVYFCGSKKEQNTETAALEEIDDDDTLPF